MDGSRQDTRRPSCATCSEEREAGVVRRQDVRDPYAEAATWVPARRGTPKAQRAPPPRRREPGNCRSAVARSRKDSGWHSAAGQYRRDRGIPRSAKLPSQEQQKSGPIPMWRPRRPGTAGVREWPRSTGSLVWIFCSACRPILPCPWRSTFNVSDAGSRRASRADGYSSDRCYPVVHTAPLPASGGHFCQIRPLILGGHNSPTREW